ncbi:hypothetical protein C5167_022891 [Papaver somniferum]|uniref:Uncharacterized protein n=1 Tax=Papaver somniferum TaxID=3469 RepID=A0A4Y7JMY3_PAPSO|nr:hypothetical protein C5167_022891 [Papaver somniferum]
MALELYHILDNGSFASVTNRSRNNYGLDEKYEVIKKWEGAVEGFESCETEGVPDGLRVEERHIDKRNQRKEGVSRRYMENAENKSMDEGHDRTTLIAEEWDKVQQYNDARCTI